MKMHGLPLVEPCPDRHRGTLDGLCPILPIGLQTPGSDLPTDLGTAELSTDLVEHLQ